MAVESKIHSLSSISIKKYMHRPLFNIEERVLEYNPASIHAIPRRQICSLLRRAEYHPQLWSVYIRLINIIILDEIVFKSFNLNKKSRCDKENE